MSLPASIKDYMGPSPVGCQGGDRLCWWTIHDDSLQVEGYIADHLPSCGVTRLRPAPYREPSGSWLALNVAELLTAKDCHDSRRVV